MKNLKELSIECSINLHKRTHGVKFTNRTSKAIKEIRKFAKKTMNVNDIRIDTLLNKEICKNGPRRIPFRMKIRLCKKNWVSERGNGTWVVFVTYVNPTCKK
mmetsp:Transcript_531/g.1258  ORF Transcript_531/g.1258 Transcript_531/m.1258 type:complete len:102 (-) Transcript_531:2727-3032(-)